MNTKQLQLLTHILNQHKQTWSTAELNQLLLHIVITQDEEELKIISEDWHQQNS